MSAKTLVPSILVRVAVLALFTMSGKLFVQNYMKLKLYKIIKR